MVLTLAQLKRDAKSGKLYGELVERFGSTEILERLRGLRKILDANSVGITFLNTDGKKSECRIEKAALAEYTGDSLTVYNPGFRDLNADEIRIMDGWKKIASTDEYKRQSEVDALSDGSSTYWQEKAYYHNAGKMYLMGLEEQAGCQYDFNTGKIRDSSIKGDAILKYKIVMVG